MRNPKNRVDCHRLDGVNFAGIGAAGPRRRGLECTASIKQMDLTTLAGISRRIDCIITLEEHSVLNGLESAVAELVGEARPLLVYRIGINDKFSSLCGTYDYLLEEHALTAHATHQKIIHFLNLNGLPQA